MKEHLKRYIDYIVNTGHDPLPIEAFDEDWEPIGRSVRGQLLAAGAITIAGDGIRLTDAGSEAVSE